MLFFFPQSLKKIYNLKHSAHKGTHAHRKTALERRRRRSIEDGVTEEVLLKACIAFLLLLAKTTRTRTYAHMIEIIGVRREKEKKKEKKEGKVITRTHVRLSSFF